MCPKMPFENRCHWEINQQPKVQSEYESNHEYAHESFLSTPTAGEEGLKRSSLANYKGRCTPKSENESVILKGYKFKFQFENVNGRKKKYIICQYGDCKKVFTKTWSFLYHARMHTGEKPYVCRYCDRKFSQKSNMTKHMKHHFLTTVEQRKLYTCNLCQNAYTERYNLRVSICFIWEGFGIKPVRNQIPPKLTDIF